MVFSSDPPPVYADPEDFRVKVAEHILAEAKMADPEIGTTPSELRYIIAKQRYAIKLLLELIKKANGA